MRGNLKVPLIPFRKPVIELNWTMHKTMLTRKQALGHEKVQYKSPLPPSRTRSLQSRVLYSKTMATSTRSLRPGAYVATLTFFKPDSQDLDLGTLEKHVTRLAEAGLSGIITLGSNGEAAHLSTEERKLVTKTTVEALRSSGHDDLPVIVGASAISTRETISLCNDAAEAGGSHVLVLPPCYYQAAMTEDTIYKFYMTVAAASPLPVVLYSFPAVTAGIEMSSDLLIRISKGHPNVVGTKFTCGDSGKLGRVARAMDAMTPSKPQSPYWAVAGLADFTLQALAAKGSGVIAGGANILPKTCCEVYKLFEEGEFNKAMEVQSILTTGDWPHTAAGIGGTKQVLQDVFGYGGYPRAPLGGVSSITAQALQVTMQEVIDHEAQL
jgi:L-threo-3-deoxy-hexylosonate aldolase